MKKGLVPSCPATRRGEAGFTLIEIIIVMTLSSIVGLGIISSFVSGMKMWDRARKVSLTDGGVWLTMERIAKELRQSVDIPLVNFEGEKDSLSFPLYTGNTVSKIVYLFDDHNKSILRRQTELKDITAEGGEQNYVERRTLAADGLSLKYLYFDPEKEAYSWVETWEKDAGIFHAVKLTIKAAGEEFTKTVFIPIEDDEG